MFKKKTKYSLYQEAFAVKFADVTILNHSSINRLVKNFKETGSVES